MDPADLLFADDQRIDHYFAQIGGRSSRTELSGEIGLDGWRPIGKLKAKEQREKPSAYAKIDAIKKYLEKRSLLHFDRPLDTDRDVDFVEEICVATRVEIPSRQQKDKKRKKDKKRNKIVLWTCSPTLNAERSGILILVQDFTQPDERPTSFRGTSGFHLLCALVYNTRKEIDDSIIGARLPHEPHPNLYVQFGTPDHPWSLSEYHSVRQYIYDFAKDPTSLLKSWNCPVSLERGINVVYKVREWGKDPNLQKTTVFGYPVWIFAA